MAPSRRCKQGEGKTLAGLMPAVLHALAGRGVHVATPNDYLAARDHAILGPVISTLGMSAGLLGDEKGCEDRARAYACDITYGPGYAFGFDFLRDQVARRGEKLIPLGNRIRQRLQGNGGDAVTMGRGQYCAILDEVDHVLIDDAVSPLVLSGASNGEAADAQIHRAARESSLRLVEGRHYLRNAAGLSLTPAGFEFIYESDQAVGDPALVRPWHDYVRLALRAEYELVRDIHYVVSNEKVKIIDRSTGRIYDDRSWNDGQHQAIEAKENLKITPENNTLARVSRQTFFRRYPLLEWYDRHSDRMSGRTGADLRIARRGSCTAIAQPAKNTACTD